MDTQAAVDKAGADKVALFSIASPAYGSTDVGRSRPHAALKVKTPVLRDEGFRLLQQLAVRGVPNIAIVDAEGKLRLSNGGSLTQSLEYKLDVEGAIRRVATTGRLGTYGALPTYYPVTELVGKKCPDFDAPLIDDATAHSFSSMLASDKLNVLIFWSVDCPHCKASLPKLNDWLKGHAAGMNVISAARITDDATKTRTAEYCKISGFVFPTFVDKDMQIGSTYQVISTPTVLVIRPDGVVDSVLLSSETDLGAALEAKRREILNHLRQGLDTAVAIAAVSTDGRRRHHHRPRRSTITLAIRRRERPPRRARTSPTCERLSRRSAQAFDRAQEQLRPGFFDPFEMRHHDRVEPGAQPVEQSGRPIPVGRRRAGRPTGIGGKHGDDIIEDLYDAGSRKAPGAVERTRLPRRAALRASARASSTNGASASPAGIRRVPVHAGSSAPFVTAQHRRRPSSKSAAASPTPSVASTRA